MLNAHARKNWYVTYQKGDKVFVRVLKTNKNKGKKRHRIMQGYTVKRFKDSDMYKVKMKCPEDDKLIKRKVSVSYM